MKTSGLPPEQRTILGRSNHCGYPEVRLHDRRPSQAIRLAKGESILQALVGIGARSRKRVGALIAVMGLAVAGGILVWAAPGGATAYGPWSYAGWGGPY